MSARATTRKRNAGEGNLFRFHGAFHKKSDAVRKEAELNARGESAFIRMVPVKGQFRFGVMTKRNPALMPIASQRALPARAIRYAERGNRIQDLRRKSPAVYASLTPAQRRDYDELARRTATVHARQHTHGAVRHYHKSLKAARMKNPNVGDVVTVQGVRYTVYAVDPDATRPRVAEELREQGLAQRLYVTREGGRALFKIDVSRAGGYGVRKLNNPSLLARLKKALGLSKTTKKYTMPLYRGHRSAAPSGKSRGRSPAVSSDPDLVSALRNLGYRAPTAKAMAARAQGASLDEKLRSVLKRNPAGVRIVHNRLLGGWFVVRGPHQTPLSGRFESKEAARASLKRNPSYSVAKQGSRWYVLRDGELLKRGSEPTNIESRGYPSKREAERALREKLSSNPARPRKRARRNPQPASAKARGLYQRFHGEPSRRVARVEKKSFPGRDDLAQLGQLTALFTLSDDARDVGTFKFSTGDGVRVCATPEGKQIYLLGGNQNVEQIVPQWCGRTGKDLVDLGRCYHIRYLARKGFDGFAPAEYGHDFGRSEAAGNYKKQVPVPQASYAEGELPRLQYDRVRKQLMLVGGMYRAKPEGIVN